MPPSCFGRPPRITIREIPYIGVLRAPGWAAAGCRAGLCPSARQAAKNPRSHARTACDERFVLGHPDSRPVHDGQIDTIPGISSLARLLEACPGLEGVGCDTLPKQGLFAVWCGLREGNGGDAGGT